MDNCRVVVFACIVFFWPLSQNAQELPQIIHSQPKQEGASGQAWGITQDNNGVMWFARNSGLYAWDSAETQRYPLPDGQIVRCVAIDKKNRIYVGGYGAFGYWDVTPKGGLRYHALSQSTELQSIGTEEIWHIITLPQGVVFQSFSKIFYYDYQTVTEITPPGVILFGIRFGEDVLFPVLDKGIYRWSPRMDFDILPQTEQLAGQRIAGMVPMGEGWLVATEQSGIWYYEKGNLRQWQNDIAVGIQINKLSLMKNGMLAVGTIQEGVYLLNHEGTTVYHLNQKTGLANNTILSLFEDRQGNLWVGLDKGIDLVVLSSPLLFFSRKENSLGTVYTGAFYDETLYVGTNQGLFTARRKEEKHHSIWYLAAKGRYGRWM
ncbi:MAG: two-component regulator propeller domain-containing protein [Saprospiraceae bacterium]